MKRVTKEELEQEEQAKTAAETTQRDAILTYVTTRYKVNERFRRADVVRDGNFSDSSVGRALAHACGQLHTMSQDKQNKMYYRTGKEYEGVVETYIKVLKDGEAFTSDQFEKAIGVEIEDLIKHWPEHTDGRRMSMFGFSAIQKLSNGRYCRWKA